MSIRKSILLILLAALIALWLSLDFMMPVGTPPSAIAYSTGFLRVSEMIKKGFLVNIGTGRLILACYLYLLNI